MDLGSRGFNCQLSLQNYQPFQMNLFQKICPESELDKLQALIAPSNSAQPPEDLDYTPRGLRRISNTDIEDNILEKPSVESRPPRPPNSFIIYRREKHLALSRQKKDQHLHNNIISKMIAAMWHEEPVSVKAIYAAKAEAEKAAHKLKYPGYKYKPRKSSKISKDITPYSAFPSRSLSISSNASRVRHMSISSNRSENLLSESPSEYFREERKMSLPSDEILQSDYHSMYASPPQTSTYPFFYYPDFYGASRNYLNYSDRQVNHAVSSLEDPSITDPNWDEILTPRRSSKDTKSGII